MIRVRTFNIFLFILAYAVLPLPLDGLEPPAMCGSLSLSHSQITRSLKTSVRSQILPFVVGDTLSFRALNFSTFDRYTLTATCQFVGVHCYVFVQDEEWGNRVHFPEVDRLADAFDRASSADPSKGIHQLNTETFGPPPDVDGDPKILILVLDIVDDHATTGNFFSGYFDIENQSAPIGREIIYIDDRPLDIDSRLARSTLAHELQHMIHWNADPTEAIWVDEGCAGYSELLNGYTDTIDVASTFLEFTNIDLTGWQDDRRPLEDEKAFLFVSYFADRYGLSAIHNLVQNPIHGIEGFESALSEIQGASTFEGVFADWTVANLLDTTGRFGYSEFQISDLSAETVTQFPMGSSLRQVELWAARYFDFGGQEGLRIGFEGGVQDSFRVHVVSIRSGSPFVLKMALTARKGEIRTVQADRVVAVVARTGGGAEEGSFFISADPFEPSSASRSDFDGDGRVDLDDFFLFADGFGLASGQEGFNLLFDLDGDDVIDLDDFFMFAELFGSEA